MTAGSAKRSLTVILLSLAIALSIVFIIIGAQGARGWGWTTHRFIADEAVNVFSDGSFFSVYRATISNYSIMPDQWKSSDSYERYRHWYHVDEPEGENEYYRGGLPNNWRILDEGVLPWAVKDNFASLVQSLEDEDWERAAQLMGAISHYTEDATMPLHATSDYSPGGMHTTYESEVNGHLGEISIPDYVPQELENIFEATMATLEGSFNFTDEDPEGGVNLSDFLEQGILWNDTIQDITENRVRAGIQFTANLWYTAMIQAGLTIQAPTLLEPENGISITTSTPTFTWTSVDGTSFHDFQMASDNGFTSDVVTVKGISTTYTPEDQLASDNWYWRVRSGDNSTHVGLWSSTQQFTVTENYQVSISISPSYQSGVPGATLNYIVTVVNMGNITDNYTLENTDNAGWSLSLGNASLTVPRNENRTTTLSVAIPSGAIENESTEITVTATSQADPAVSASGTCTAAAGKKPEPKPEPVSGFPVIPVAISVVIAIIACLAVYRIYWAGR